MLGSHYEVVEPIQRAEPSRWVQGEIVQAIMGIRALSRASGVSEAMLYRYLAGRCDIPRRALLALAGAAGVDAGWLLAGEDAQHGQANAAAQSSGTNQPRHLRTRSRAGPSGRS
ncbi:MAG: hypothetical protein AB7I42_29335 [Bradyrhizobium sp.]|uniref:hypothetical protein n=1 Tax=Bradyrhizobium sp. TaxID=376 RepID=UPI003D0A5ED4